MLAEIKKEIKAITDFLETIPEKYREKVFDFLLSSLEKKSISTLTPPDKKSHQKNEHHPDSEQNGTTDNSITNKVKNGFVIPAKVRAFLTRNSLNDDNLTKLIMPDAEEIHFVREPTTEVISAGQVQWSLLLALKQAVLGGDFSVDAEAVRSICIEKGLYDRSNFSKNFKQKSTLYQSLPQGQGESVKLSRDGEKELADLIKQLTS